MDIKKERTKCTRQINKGLYQRSISGDKERETDSSASRRANHRT
jgi:hypothetical protein